MLPSSLSALPYCARVWLLSLATLPFIAACATGTPPRAPASAPPPAYQSAPSGAPAQALDQWWKLYRDPQLSALTSRALAQGFSVREALARLEESRALNAVSLSRFDLQGDLQGNAEHRQTRDLEGGNAAGGAGPGIGSGADRTSTSRTASLSLPVSWELDFVGRRSVTQRGAEADLEAARFDVQAARAAIAAEVARALFQARGLHVQRDEARETVRIQQDLMAVVTERVKRGLAPSSEVDRVAGDLAQAEAQAADLAAALLAARRALLAVVGDGTAALTELETSATLGAAPAIPVALPGELLTRRPDVRTSLASIEKAASQVRLAELEFYPRLTLTPGIGLSAQGGSIDSRSAFWSVGAGLVVPMLDRPRLMAQLAIEGARAEQAVLAYERSVQNAFSEADQALTRLQADQRRVVTLAGGEVRARAAYDAALRRYQLGFADLQELLDGERSWRAARSTLTVAKVDALQRSVQVFQALGGGWNASQTQ
ncbi:efflux transporter outer membrane subunit [Pseudomonas benzenivorans]|uniref:TolC family protein n=1 Tax=Pseudomonas benzenivorans TaxID=556533 RepID=A0ABY5HA26_9PSED|nr:TolC family protein [Pseudomonas benzenivorans]UTW08463.1 TolC family protein [Pseudomonas benzenivorans]